MRSANAVKDINDVVGDVQSFVADNRETLGHDVGQAGLGDSSPRRQHRRHQADAAHHPRRVPELPQHLPARPGHVHRRHRAQQLRQPDLVPVRRDSGGVTAGRRAVGEAVRAVPGADRQEPAVQLPADRRKPLRRRSGPSQRDHLQRGLDAAGLRSTPGTRRCTCTPGRGAPAAPAPDPPPGPTGHP